METVGAARTRHVGGILFDGLFAIAIYLFWLFAFCRGFEGLIYQLSKLMNSWAFNPRCTTQRAIGT
jgi:hypothetical protein